MLYNTSEIIKMTGITSAKLKYLDDYEKLVPVKRTTGRRYYSEEQLIEIMQYMNKAVEAAYVCVEYTNNTYTEGKLDTVNEILKKKELQMKNCIANFNDNIDIVFMSEILVNRNFKDSTLEILSKKAIKGAVKKIYVNTEIGFPADLIPEYIKWLSYVNVELIDLAKIRREENTKSEVASNE